MQIMTRKCRTADLVEVPESEKMFTKREIAARFRVMVVPDGQFETVECIPEAGFRDEIPKSGRVQIRGEFKKNYTPPPATMPYFTFSHIETLPDQKPGVPRKSSEPQGQLFYPKPAGEPADTTICLPRHGKVN